MRTLRAVIARLTRRTGVKRGVLFVLVFSVCAAILTINLIPESVALEIGQASPRYIGAPRQIEDRYTTQVLRQEAVNSVPEVFEQNANVYPQVLREQEEVLAMFLQVAMLADLSDAEKLEILALELPYEFSEVALEAALTIDEVVLEQMQAEMALALDGIYRLGIKLDGLDNARQSVTALLNSSSLRVSYRILMVELARSTMRHNMTPNEAATRRLKQEAESRVSPVIVQKTQKIIGQGEIATEREITLLQDLGLLQQGMDYKLILGGVLYAFLCLMLPAMYMYFLGREVYNDDHSAALVGVVLMGGMLFAWAGSLLSGYIIPVAAVGILLTALIDARIGLLGGFSLAMMAAGMVGFEFRFVIIALLGTAAAVYAVTSKGNRAGLVLAGVIVGIINLAAVGAFGLLFGATAAELITDGALALAGGLTASILAIGSLSFLENSFALTSTVKLIELANPQQELLKRLLVEAPGTYHHSIIVANLAEAAAEQVGADALRARVGAYYHDVGKMTRPYFFIENQIMMDNPHDNYPPNLSAAIIIAHVKDGVKLAQKHKIPPTIVDIIREHHGSSKVHYFYNRALAAGEVNEADYMYEGPRPHSKESAIVMLADIVEAAVRAIDAPTAAKIAERVRKVIRDKLYEGQLDKSDLTMRDLEDIGDAFIRHLSGIFHQRIEYPQMKREG